MSEILTINRIGASISTMTKLKSNALPNRPQPDKFRDLARDLECDEDEEAFKAKLRKVAKVRLREPKPNK